LRVLLCLLFLLCGCTDTKDVEIVVGEVESVALGHSERICIKLKGGRHIIGYVSSGFIIPKRAKITVDFWLKIEPVNLEE